MTAAPLDWVVAVPCIQVNITEPVVVPVDAILLHLAKSRHLVVMPDHLSNGQGLVTPFNKNPKINYEIVLDCLPQTPEGKAVQFDLDLNAVDRTLIAAGKKDIRYYLNGLLFDLTDGVLVGCDGHRLHIYQNRVPKAYKRKLVDGVPTTPVVEVIVHRAPLDWIVHSASPAVKVTIWNADRPKVKEVEQTPRFLLQTDDAFVWVKSALNGKFPDYSRVLPKVSDRPICFEVNPVDLSDKVEKMTKVVRLASNKKSESVRVDFGLGQVAGMAKTDVLPFTVGSASADEAVKVADFEDSLWACVCGTYMQDLADCVTGAARWYLNHENASNCAVLVVDGDFSGVVMPLRITDKDGGTRVYLEAQAAKLAADKAASHYATEEEAQAA